MISKNKLSAVRANGRKSRGPKTPSGKLRASHNALRHGLSIVNRSNPAFSNEIEQMAKAICVDLTNPALFEQAIVIAENAFLLRFIQSERVALIEQFHDPTAVSRKKTNALIAVGEARLQQMNEAYREYAYLQDILTKRGEMTFADFAPIKFKPGEIPPKYVPPKERDEYEAMQEAMPDLQRLLRYERRALSKLKRAVSVFLAIMVTSHFGISAQLGGMAT